MNDKSTVSKGFKLKEVEKFVKNCAKMGAVDIKVGEIHVIFDGASQPTRKPRKAERIAQEEADKKANLTEQLNLLNDEISISHVEDPVGFEEAIARGEMIEEIHSQ